MVLRVLQQLDVIVEEVRLLYFLDFFEQVLSVPLLGRDFPTGVRTLALVLRPSEDFREQRVRLQRERLRSNRAGRNVSEIMPSSIFSWLTLSLPVGLLESHPGSSG